MNVIIFHGTDGRPDVAWYPWLKERLEAQGNTVEVPHYPMLNHEPLQTFLPKVLQRHVFDEQTVLIGHSGGAALILGILEHIATPVAQAILVAGYMTPPNTNEEPVLQPSYDSDAIRAHCEDIYYVNSINDPYGCDDKQGRKMFDLFGGTQIIRNDGHFGSPDQDYPTFELLASLVKAGGTRV